MLGGYLSPVNDAYGKPDLAPASHRCLAWWSLQSNGSFAVVHEPLQCEAGLVPTAC